MEGSMVSVILPVYNSESDVLPAIEEIEKQTFHNYELIIVDDGSADSTYTVVKAYSEGNSKVRLIRTDHFGPSHARNVGLNEATGDVVVFVESDCVYDDSYLAKAVAQLEADPGASAVCLTGAPLITRATLATRCIDIENKVQHLLLSRGKIKPFYAWVFRRAEIQRLGGFDERLFQAEDRDLFMRMEEAHYRVALVPGINWRHRRDQTMLELSKKWFARGRTRILYTLKHGLAVEALRTMLPLWVTVAGAILLLSYPWAGVLLLLAVAGVFVLSAARVVTISWSVVKDRRAYLGYPVFVLVRNFSTALGYSTALPTIISRTLRRKELSWKNL